MKLIKNKIITGISVAALLIVSSLNTDAQKAEFGLRFMPTFSSFEMKTSSGSTIKGELTLGYGVGAFLGFNLSDHIGIQAEVIYSSITQKYEEVDIERKVNLRYVNIPLLLSINTDKSKPVNVNFVVGPQLGLSVGSKLSVSSDEGTSDLQALLLVKKSDFGLAYGAGLDFGLNQSRNIRLGVGFRGVLGLVDVSDKSTNITTNSYYILDRTHIKTYSGYFGFSWVF